MTSPVAHLRAESGSLGVPARPSDPRVRNLLLLAEWERDDAMTVCGPYGHVQVSSKCMAQGVDKGRGFVTALVAAADRAWQEELRFARA